jgi:hypothetical protein
VDPILTSKQLTDLVGLLATVVEQWARSWAASLEELTGGPAIG